METPIARSAIIASSEEVSTEEDWYCKEAVFDAEKKVWHVLLARVSWKANRRKSEPEEASAKKGPLPF